MPAGLWTFAFAMGAVLCGITACREETAYPFIVAAVQTGTADDTPR